MTMSSWPLREQIASVNVPPRSIAIRAEPCSTPFDLAAMVNNKEIADDNVDGRSGIGELIATTPVWGKCGVYQSNVVMLIGTRH